MKVTKTVQVPAKTETALDHIGCELCENTTKDSQRVRWTNGRHPYEFVETAVTLRTGSSYPEGGQAETVVLDICPKCFEEKLVPWFQSQGGTAREESSDW